ncbi:hypothetical protein AA0472_1837 [Acetobacter estunensis NRIC 0472]|uniref:Uncharacterized protein n=1 Tax=Acetobacter estunensis TaxID=104097 RepID=A0A967B956_9PROT|nr:hypothetical protein [Acetobacter estunensis]NHO55198.1 hypothetical protein [Acetobacter estunensis]GBQ25667.1 hypothetical protein AA0472_1837 [Acetobacter estunensis NRIC 0472]
MVDKKIERIEHLDSLRTMCLKLAATPINTAPLASVTQEREADARLHAWLRYYERSRSVLNTCQEGAVDAAYFEKRRLAWLRDFVRCRSRTAGIEIWDLRKKSWVELRFNLRVLCPDVIRNKATFDQIEVEIAQLVDPANHYTNAQRLEWLKTNIRRRPGRSAIEMWDAKQTLWLPLSDAKLRDVYPVYVRGNVPDRQVGLEFVQVLESLASPNYEDPVVRRALEQRTTCLFYSNIQRLMWLRDYTRRNLETDDLEIWHVLHDTWAVVKRETVDGLCPSQVKGCVSEDQLWDEIVQSADLAPSYEGRYPPVRHYTDDDVILWAWQNCRYCDVDGPLQVKIYSIMEGKWFRIAGGAWIAHLPKALTAGRHDGQIQRLLTTGMQSLYGLPFPYGGRGTMTVGEVASDLLFGGVETGLSLDTAAEIKPLMTRIQELTDPVLREQLGTDMQGGVTMAKIAAEVLDYEPGLKPAEQAYLSRRLKDLGWVQRRTAAARLWCPPAGFTRLT